MTTQDQQSPTPKTPLPRYRCHKVVEAAQITAVGWQALSLLNPPSDVAVVVYVTDRWIAKHEPKVGGYFVRYDDGYESFSPVDAFESGYTRIEA